MKNECVIPSYNVTLIEQSSQNDMVIQVLHFAWPSKQCGRSILISP